MDIGEAVRLLKSGRRVARKDWNGAGMWLYYVPADVYPTTTRTAREQFGATAPYNAYVAMKTARGDVAVWTASQSDLLGEDWFEIEEAQNG